MLTRCNIVNNDYQNDSRVRYISVPSKSFGQLLDVSPKNFIYLKTFDSEFLYVEVWLTDQNSKPLETEDKMNITLETDHVKQSLQMYLKMLHKEQFKKQQKQLVIWLLIKLLINL